MIIPPLPIFSLYGLVTGKAAEPTPPLAGQTEAERLAYLAGWRQGFDTGQNATMRLPQDDEAVRAWMDWAAPGLQRKTDRRA